jgi:histidine triad (HIT) family protein
MDDCIFCAIVEGRAPSETVYEDDATMAFMDINPVADGHVLVVPKRHAADMWDISEEDARACMATALRVAGTIEQALQPDGLNVFQATRPAGWQTVPHFHLHVLPRHFDDPLEPPWDPTNPPGDRAKIGEVAAKLRAGT